MATPEEAITLTTSGKVAVITLNLPHKLNALTQELYFRLATLLREAGAHDDIFITVLTGKGRYFSAGADVTARPQIPTDISPRLHFLRSFAANNLEITHAFFSHPNILVTALNGPVIGLSAALIAFSDFVYAAPHTFLLTPFTSLGLVAEGGASRAFVQRLGISKANEALIMSRRIGCEELVQTGFVNKVFPVRVGEDERFLELVLEEVREKLGEHLASESLVRVKELIRRPEIRVHEAQLVSELMGGLERFEKGVPQEEFRKIASGEKKHKL